MKNLLFILAVIMIGCGTSLEDAKEAGFSSVTEFKKYQKYGFKDKASFISTGFSSLEEFETYSKEGFKSMDSFSATGFSSLEQFIKLKRFGNTFNEVLDYRGVSLQKFKECKLSNYDVNCKGKFASMYATLESFSYDGVRLELKEDCLGQVVMFVDAKNLDESFYDSNQNRCAKFLFKIEDENWFTPDIFILETLWLESKDEYDSRLVKINKDKAKKIEADSKALEQNKKNASWLAEKFMGEASYICSLLIEQYAKYDFEWIGYGAKFPNYSNKVKKPYVLTISGDRLKVQNGFGAWQRKKYSCDYNVKEKKPIKVNFK